MICERCGAHVKRKWYVEERGPSAGPPSVWVGEECGCLVKWCSGMSPDAEKCLEWWESNRFNYSSVDDRAPYEYRVGVNNSEEFQVVLDEAVAEGWELHYVIHRSIGSLWHYVMRRKR